jgi:hypothetical protein
MNKYSFVTSSGNPAIGWDEVRDSKERTDGEWCLSLDAEAAIAEARKQGAKELSDTLVEWVWNDEDRRNIYEVMADHKSRGASEPRCTCNPHDVTYKGHSPDCPCYKPPENEWSCPCEGSHVENEKCECSCHEKPQSTDRLPLEVIREADWGAPLEEFRKYINALVDRVNELSK